MKEYLTETLKNFMPLWLYWRVQYIELKYFLIHLICIFLKPVSGMLLVDGLVGAVGGCESVKKSYFKYFVRNTLNKVFERKSSLKSKWHE